MSGVSISAEQLKAIEKLLLNASGKVPLLGTFKALFALKALKSKDSVTIISEGFQDPSALLMHELAYCLAQVKKTSALPEREAALTDSKEDPMVRHE
ncbi:hypothetical protein MPER_06597, partial [Moniliophthora perniciosa FA553]